jgi:hypothetical protein
MDTTIVKYADLKDDKKGADDREYRAQEAIRMYEEKKRAQKEKNITTIKLKE